jgi:hypothetical protein
MTPFSLRIFVANGHPDGLRIVDKSNWIGKALVFPRALLPQVKARPELAQTGVYLLLGPRPIGSGDMLYVGEGNPISPRLESHYVQKDFWTRAVGFTNATVAAVVLGRSANGRVEWKAADGRTLKELQEAGANA